MNKNFKHSPNLKRFISELEIVEKLNIILLIRVLSSIIETDVNEFSTRFNQFEEFKEPIKIIIYPDTLSFEKPI